MTRNLKKAARFALKGLMLRASRSGAAGPIGEGTPPAWAGPVADICPSALGSSAVACEDNGVGPPRRSAAGTAGGTRAVSMAVMAYGLWQVLRWGGHQALIGDLAFVLVNGGVLLLAWRASQRAGPRRNAWRLLVVALLLCESGHLLQLADEMVLHDRACPAWADAACLGFYPVAFRALVSFPGRHRSRKERLRLLLDAGMVLVGGAMLTWCAVPGRQGRR